MYRKLFLIILILIGGFFLAESKVLALDTNSATDTTYILASTEDCSDVLDKDVVDFLQQVFSVMCYLGVGLCMLLSISDFVKATASQDKDALIKATKTTGKRLVYAIILFLIPMLVDFVFEYILGWSGSCGIG